MKLREIVRIVQGEMLYDAENILEREYSYAVASDLMSNVMLGAADDSVLITSLVNSQTIRASEMMNITCIVITCGKTATDVMIELAQNRNIALVSTEYTTFTACGKLHQLGITEGALSLENGNITSIRLDTDQCIGCTHCVRECPTEAIRVRGWKAVVNADRCIECGTCIKVCPRRAIKPIVDKLCSMDEYDYRIAIPSSAFLGQFKGVKSRNHLLTALKWLGFDDVYEEAIGAESVSYVMRRKLDELRKKRAAGDNCPPLISSGCPSVLKLIQIKYPNLINSVVEYRPPVEVVAAIARERAEKIFPDKRIGIFFISPCTAKVSFIKESDEIIDTDVDVMVGITEVYKKVLHNLKSLKDEDVENLEKSGVMGLRWVNPGGESLALATDKFVAVDGIEKVMDIFEMLEDEKLGDVEFIEAEACVGGCFGGSLTVENSYSAKSNMKKIVDEAKEKYGDRILNIPEDENNLKRNRELNYRPVLQLDEDINVSLKKMEEMCSIVNTLPGIDCGACGAPNCKSFAEDIVRGLITEKACIFFNRNVRRKK